MQINNSLFCIVLAVLGIFLTVVSLHLSSVIQTSSVCEQENSLANSNRIVLIIGIVLFMSSLGYLKCNQSLHSSTSDIVFASFNLALGIVIIVLFAIISSELKKCNATLSSLDSLFIDVGIIIGVVSTSLSLFILGKKLYDNREVVKQKFKSSSPYRLPEDYIVDKHMESPVKYMDPFGYDD
jgi:hypothetical protein